MVWFGSPHVPLKPLPEDLKAAGGSAYYGELVGVDRSMGTLRAGLRKLGIADNTMLWFNSDNGAWLDEKAPDAHGSNGVLRGHKGRTVGGRHPRARADRVAGADQAAVGHRRARRAPATSIRPSWTLLKLEVPNQVQPLDGISLVPLLDGQMKERPKPIGFWHHGETGLEDGPVAWIDNRYKLHKRARNKYELYDLSADPRKNPTSPPQHPEIVTRMKAGMDNWQQSVLRAAAGLPGKKGDRAG